MFTIFHCQEYHYIILAYTNICTWVQPLPVLYIDIYWNWVVWQTLAWKWKLCSVHFNNNLYVVFFLRQYVMEHHNVFALINPLPFWLNFLSIFILNQSLSLLYFPLLSLSFSFSPSQAQGSLKKWSSLQPSVSELHQSTVLEDLADAQEVKKHTHIFTNN